MIWFWCYRAIIWLIFITGGLFVILCEGRKENKMIKNVCVEEVEKCTIIKNENLTIRIENGQVTIDTSLPVILQGQTLKKLAHVRSSVLNEVVAALLEG